MGSGSYSSADWSKLKASRGIDSGNVNTIFSKKTMDPKYDPKYIGKRESCDSDEHPNSTPIIVGVDVTGSMGYLSESIIKNSLNDLMLKLYSTELVRDPQLLFAAIGDVRDDAPLQVTQFESDIRIAEQLMDLWIEGRGGDGPEDYELLWYFAAKHTQTDCFSKHGNKGFIFTIGDAGCHEALSSFDIKHIFGDDAPDSYSKSLADEAGKKYELFHIFIGSCPENFASLIPGRVILVDKDKISYLPEIIISAIQLTKGKAKEKIVAQWDELSQPVIRNALSLITAVNGDTISF